MWWALHGVPVTVVDEGKERIDLIRKVWSEVPLQADFIDHPLCDATLPFGDKSFDMGWNFASLWFMPDLESFLKELARITKTVIFICVPNRLGLGYLSRLAFQKNDDSGLYLNNITSGRIKKIMRRLDWKVSEQGFLDIPPWPDIAMKKEDLLQKIGFKGFADRIKNKDDNHLCILDYYSGKKKNMESEITKYAFLEHSPWIVKRFWAHHWYAVFSPM
jgi:SAM-dependent methyltransferase